jgi:hypothetical protein
MTDDPERRRWENLMRALVNVVRQMERPDSRYTLSIRLVCKEQAGQTTR